jgi:hypothetical protein
MQQQVIQRKKQQKAMAPVAFVVEAESTKSRIFNIRELLEFVHNCRIRFMQIPET